MSDWIEKIHAHADGEQVDAAEVQRILDSEPSAPAEHQWAVYIRQTLSTKLVQPDHTFAWEKAKARLDAIDALEGDSRVGSFVARHGWAFAACLLVIILFAGLMNHGQGALSSQELAGVFAAPPVSQSVDGEGADEFAVQNNFNALPRVEPVVRVLRAGRGVHDGTEFLRLEMVDNSGPLTMFVFKTENGFDGFDRIPGRSEYVGGMVNGQAAVGWTDSGFAYMLMCERSVEEVVSIADQMRH